MVVPSAAFVFSLPVTVDISLDRYTFRGNSASFVTPLLGAVF